ncbi:hypothetical protein SAMN05421736_104300 [Evansella caseinilytica]|uniref:Uncharacterized protein n=1 Tax=Evansella caseinilytica TaxID=1503961 RepID=A0A1H3P1X3_9BACI|nr:hypothetical protein SAMN05421736_104300 [Evansella caseinilytica]
MPAWLIVILVIVVLAVIIYLPRFFKARRSNTQTDDDASQRICKTCLTEIPNDFTKSLCPHCKSFLS